MKMLYLFFSLTFFGCDTDKKELPILSYKIDESGNKVNYSISYENFTNHLDESFTTANLTDKLVVSNFFFTNCPSICPSMRNELIKIAKIFEKEKDLMIISHTIDPDNDTIEVLKKYSAKTGISDDKWQFLRSSIENTKKQAQSYMTNFKKNNDGVDFYHSSYLTLIDKNKMIRGFYNSLIKEDVERLTDDIHSLLE